MLFVYAMLKPRKTQSNVCKIGLKQEELDALALTEEHVLNQTQSIRKNQAGEATADARAVTVSRKSTLICSMLGVGYMKQKARTAIGKR